MFKFLSPYLLYIKIGLGICILIFISYLYSKNNTLNRENNRLKENVTMLETVNETNLRAVKNLEELRQKDAEQIRAFLADLSLLRASTDKLKKKLSDLELNDAGTRNYLSIPIPVNLQRVLSEKIDSADSGKQP